MLISRWIFLENMEFVIDFYRRIRDTENTFIILILETQRDVSNRISLRYLDMQLYLSHEYIKMTTHAWDIELIYIYQEQADVITNE
jgi:hypothetical protein